jgi:hypothetical protein
LKSSFLITQKPIKIAEDDILNFFNKKEEIEKPNEIIDKNKKNEENILLMSFIDIFKCSSLSKLNF